MPIAWAQGVLSATASTKPTTVTAEIIESTFWEMFISNFSAISVRTKNTYSCVIKSKKIQSPYIEKFCYIISYLFIESFICTDISKIP